MHFHDAKKFREAVIKRPSMYLGDFESSSAANNVVRELIANSIDQFLVGKVHEIKVDIIGMNICVRDDGAGLPFDRVWGVNPKYSEGEAYLLFPHTTATANNHAPHIHMVSQGLGLAIVNAVSSIIEVEADNGVEFWECALRNGEYLKNPVPLPSNGKPMSRFKLSLNSNLFKHGPDLLQLRKEIIDQSYLYSGLKIALNDEVFYSKNGLMDCASEIHATRTLITEAPRKFSLNKSGANYDLQIALIGDCSEGSISRSWANGVVTHNGGTHTESLSLALKYIGWTPAVSLIHIIMNNPIYAGPTRHKLSVPEYKSPLTNLLIDELEKALN